MDGQHEATKWSSPSGCSQLAQNLPLLKVMFLWSKWLR